ncbi:MAG: GPR endopeptidase, partial [Peptostreptococcales bacterium]
MIRTDLAIESREIYSKNKEIEIEGVIVTKDSLQDMDITRIKIVNENGSKSLAKPQGNYITIEIKGIEFADNELKDKISMALRDELLGIIDNKEDLK